MEGLFVADKVRVGAIVDSMITRRYGGPFVPADARWVMVVAVGDCAMRKIPKVCG